MFPSFTARLVLTFVVLSAGILALLTVAGIGKSALPLSKSSWNTDHSSSAAKNALETESVPTLTVGETTFSTLLSSTSPTNAHQSGTMTKSSAESNSSPSDKPSQEALPSQDLGSLALSKVLDDASPIFGPYANVQSDTSTWMSAYPDSTKIVHMNIPGTHDAATWNYSIETQSSLKHITNLVNDTVEFQPDSFRCQESSIIDMLNAGIRAFDLRYAQDVTNTTLVFWHGPALQSQTTTVEDVLYGFYHWLDDHPSEAVLLSFQYEPSPDMGRADNADAQNRLYKALTSFAAKRYIHQNHGYLGTLGEARGKIILLRRFDQDKLSPEHEGSIPGLHFSPKDWTVNGQNITIVYNSSVSAEERTESGTAYIQDYYSPSTLDNSTAGTNVQSKLDAIFAHLRMAASSAYEDSLFWSFSSATNILHTPPVTPRMLALGNGSEGVNHRLIPFFETMKGQRLGIVMFDFFDDPKDLIPLFLSLKRPEDEETTAVS